MVRKNIILSVLVGTFILISACKLPTVVVDHLSEIPGAEVLVKVGIVNPNPFTVGDHVYLKHPSAITGADMWDRQDAVVTFASPRLVTVRLEKTGQIVTAPWREFAFVVYPKS